MFNPSRDQARLFFIDAWRKRNEGEALSALENMAIEIIQQHPEYHPLLTDPDALQHEFGPEDGQLNPFLHLSLHLAIAEQIAINQPPGIHRLFATLALKRGDRHAALHDILDCLGETIFNAQRTRTPPDGQAYLECVEKKIG